MPQAGWLDTLIPHLQPPSTSITDTKPHAPGLPHRQKDQIPEFWPQGSGTPSREKKISLTGGGCVFHPELTKVQQQFRDQEEGEEALNYLIVLFFFP